MDDIELTLLSSDPAADLYTLHPSLSWLTQIRSLRMGGLCHSNCFRPILALTQLEELCLHAYHRSFDCDDDEYGPPLDLSPLCHLTNLQLENWEQCQVWRACIFI